MEKSTLKDLTGQKFELLRVVGRAPNRNGETMWHCVCKCGREKDISGKNLRSGRSKSCGCQVGRKPSAEGRKQLKIKNTKGLCYNVYCRRRNNYRQTVWSCSRCRKCKERHRYRAGEEKTET